MAAPIPKRLTDLRPRRAERKPLSLAADKQATELSQLLIETYEWIIEEEVSFCFGSPPWFDAAAPCVVAEIARRADEFPVEEHNLTAWIRKQAKRAARRLERKVIAEPTLPGVPGPNGIVASLPCEFRSLPESRNGSLRWNDLQLPKSTRASNQGDGQNRGEV